MKSPKSGETQLRRCLPMTDEQIALMTASEIAELIKRLIDELILRLMQMS